ncbi:hypothetical protein M885DRAFT_622913 [Pelagophyceae sp. CCMP2097]|nr:hypothetical protein M885DRAFT_622913 [Pelagophyceae sp. CCMP2097]
MKVRARALGLTRWPLAHRALSHQFELAGSWPEILGMSDDAFKAAGGSLHPRQLGAEGIYVTETGMRCAGVRQRFSCTSHVVPDGGSQGRRQPPHSDAAGRNFVSRRVLGGFEYCFNTLVGFVEVNNAPVENLRFVIANSEAQAVSGIFVPSCHSYLEEKRTAFKTRAFKNVMKLISPPGNKMKMFEFKAPAGATVALAAKRGRGADERGPTTKDLFMKKFPGGIYMSDDSVALELIKLFGVVEVTLADRLEATAKVSE